METALQDADGGLLSCVVDILPLESLRTKPGVRTEQLLWICMGEEG